MRLTTLLFKTISVSVALAALYACSNGGDSGSNLINSAGKHVVGTGYTNWVQQHWVVYMQQNGGSGDVASTTVCSECHGADLMGGTSRVSCFSASFQGMYCHANGDFTLGHPADWLDPTARNFHGGKFTTFNGKPVQGSTTLAADCGLCHAVDANSGSVGSAPSCLSTDPNFGMACHSSSPAVHSTGCISCHSGPPTGPTGITDPNVAGDHAPHINSFNLGCTACHKGGGTGTSHHAVGNGVAFLNMSGGYQAKSGTFSFAGGKCSAVSCHGGQQSPDWIGGSINVNTDCLSCHEQGTSFQTPQYNSFYSGSFTRNGVTVNLHQFHLQQVNVAAGDFSNIFCTNCHNTTKLATQHFTSLATHNFGGGDPADTVGGGNAVIPAGGYDKNTHTCSANGCHPTPVQWQ